MKIQDALDLHLKEEASRIIGEDPKKVVARVYYENDLPFLATYFFHG